MLLCELLSGGPHNPAAANAANALASVVANNGINQDAAADAGVIEAVVQLLKSASASSSRFAFDQLLLSNVNLTLIRTLLLMLV